MVLTSIPQRRIQRLRPRLPWTVAVLSHCCNILAIWNHRHNSTTTSSNSWLHISFRPTTLEKTHRNRRNHRGDDTNLYQSNDGLFLALWKRGFAVSFTHNKFRNSFHRILNKSSRMASHSALHNNYPQHGDKRIHSSCDLPLRCPHPLPLPPRKPFTHPNRNTRTISVTKLATHSRIRTALTNTHIDLGRGQRRQ